MDWSPEGITERSSCLCLGAKEWCGNTWVVVERKFVKKERGTPEIGSEPENLEERKEGREKGSELLKIIKRF